MTPDVLIICPVLDRPGNARPLVESLLESSSLEWILLFVASSGDDEQVQACLDQHFVSDRVGTLLDPRPSGPGDFAKKTQLAYNDPLYRDIPYVLLGADDLRFHAGWDTAVLGVADRFDVGVVGTNDGGNSAVMAGRHSTHPLVSRCYIDRFGGVVGEPGTVYHQGYDHQWVDCELVETAKARGCYAHCHESRVEHLHPFWAKGQDDATYRKGQARGAEDARLYASRQHLWQLERVTA